MALNPNIGVDASGDRDDNSIHEAKPDETHGEDQSLLDAAMLLSSGQSRKLEKSPSRESTAMPTNRRQSARLRSKACAPVPSNASTNMSPHKQLVSSSKSKRGKEPASSLTGKRSNLDAVADPPKRQRTASHPSEQKESTQLTPERGRSSPSTRSISPARSSTDEELSRAHGDDSSHVQRSSPAKSSRDEEKIVQAHGDSFPDMQSIPPAESSRDDELIAQEHGDSLLGVPTIPPAELSRDEELIAQEHGDDLSDAQSDSLPSSPTKSTKPRKLIAQEHAGGFPDAQSSSPSSSPAKFSTSRELIAQKSTGGLPDTQSSSPSSSPAKFSTSRAPIAQESAGGFPDARSSSPTSSSAKSTHSDDIDDFFHSLQNPPPEVIASAAARPRLSPPSRAPRPEKAATSAPEPALPALTSVREEVDVASQEDDNDTSTRPSTQASPQLKSRPVFRLPTSSPRENTGSSTHKYDSQRTPRAAKLRPDAKTQRAGDGGGGTSSSEPLMRDATAVVDLSIKYPKVQEFEGLVRSVVSKAHATMCKVIVAIEITVQRGAAITFWTILRLVRMFRETCCYVSDDGVDLFVQWEYSPASNEGLMKDRRRQQPVINFCIAVAKLGPRLGGIAALDREVGEMVYAFLLHDKQHETVGALCREDDTIETQQAKDFVVERLGGGWFRDAGFAAVWARARHFR